MFFLLFLSLFKPVPSGRELSTKVAIPVLSPKGSFLHEGFENWPPSGFTLNPSSGTGAWLQSPVNSASYISPQTGANGTSHGAEFNCWNYYSGVTGEMVSMPVDLSSTTSPMLEFYFWNHTDQTGYGNNDSTIVAVSIDNGNTWSTIAVLKGNVDIWTYYSYDLSAYIGDTILIRFTGVSDWGGSNMGIDEVRIGEPPGVDMGIGGIVSPGEYEAPSTSVVPSCVLGSISSDTQNDFYVYCVVESLGTEVYRESVYVASYSPGSSDTVQFPSFDPIQGMFYQFIFFTILTGDEYPYNDTLEIVSRFYTSQRMVVGEHFTNTGCAYCPEANDTISSIISDYPDRVAMIRYHVWWPSSSDPFYQYNIPENENRTYYYGVNAVPHNQIDGAVDGGDYYSYRALYIDEMDKNSPFDISLSGVYDTTLAAGSLFVHITATGEPYETSLYLRVCLIENGLYYAGTNGEEWHYQVFRDMLPDTMGISLGTVHIGDEVEYTIPFTIDTLNLNEDSLKFVVFVQSESNKQILQGAKIALKSIPTGLVYREGGGLRLVSTPTILSRMNNLRLYSARGGVVNIRMVDISGREVHSDYVEVNKGENLVKMDGEKLPSGVYFLHVSMGNDHILRRITLIK